MDSVYRLLTSLLKLMTYNIYPRTLKGRRASKTEHKLKAIIRENNYSTYEVRDWGGHV